MGNDEAESIAHRAWLEDYRAKRLDWTKDKFTTERHGKSPKEKSIKKVIM